MEGKNKSIKNNIIKAALPNVPFDGWTLPVLTSAAVEQGYSDAMVQSVFPAGVKDALKHFAFIADEDMLQSLSRIKPDTLKVRERITLAVRTRLEFLAGYKEAERLALSFWMRPLRKYEGAKILWNTADVIWDWAGDTATDYNRYTKRALLSGVITATTLYWLNDTSKDHRDTWQFLDRRIDNALSIGRIAGKLKKA